MNAIPAKRVAIVAELSANHGGSLEQALALVDAAARAGANAVKIQTWAKDLMVLDRAYTVPSGPWAGRNLAKLYGEAWTPWEWHGPIFERARARGIVGFTTVFDIESLHFLETEHRVPVYKIASFELNDLALVGAVARTGKPLILSTGMASLQEITEAVQTARRAGCQDLTVLRCVSAYPAGPEAAHLRTMVDIGRRFNVTIGLSDHTRGLGVAVTAAAMGAKMIEKHLKIHRDAGGLDADFSTYPDELEALVQAANDAAVAVGDVAYGATAGEAPQLELRRSLYLAKDITAGQVISREHVRSARPAKGLGPRYLDRVLGRVALADARAGSPITWALLEPADAIREASTSRL